ncbi:fibronectin type III domain-containing protein, partial [Candidatus Sumerlaeota bacterium]|nr:fibronectin type III domain-containing protein [Candidatus Sumerlaeota bacterium]
MAGPATITQSAQTVVNNFAVIPNAQGETLLPAGTACDSAEIEDGQLLVFITLPEEFPEGAITLSDVETAGEILRLQFAEPQILSGIWIMARRGPEADWQLLSDFVPTPAIEFSPDDWFEPDGPGPQPSPDYSTLYSQTLPAAGTDNVTGQGPLGTSGAPTGALAGRTVYFSGGHGWTWGTSSWYLQRPLLLSMNEDYGNIDQVNSFAHLLFNAGATVVCMRPLGHQLNEVVLDNTSAGVTWSGSWSDSSNPQYYGPGSPPYRYASAAATETATATYTPNIPEAGFYPVYCWANYGSDRVHDQLYRIRHTGGEIPVRINHRRVGCGWIWLGNYHFEAGSNPATGSVVISNQSSNPTSRVVIADAIRFGNGIGDIDRGGGISGYEREAECSRHWVQRMLGANSSSSIYDLTGYDDGSDNVGTPPRMAAEMRRDDGQGYNGDIYLGFHTNAGGGRGVVGLITTSTTPTNCADYAALIGNAVQDDCLAEDTPGNWPYTWYNRGGSITYTSAYGEFSGSNLNYEMCGTIVEGAFHDSTEDSTLLREPRVRHVIGRACYRAIVQYFNTFDGNTLAYLPEPPVRVSAVNNGSGGVTVSWEPGPSGSPSGDAATGFRVYTSPNGLGFDAGVTVPGGASARSHTVTGLTPGETYYFRVAATNAGGESLPSETLGAGVISGSNSPVLVVNGYDRIDRYNNIPTYPSNPVDDLCERLFLDRNNSYNYIIQHGEALSDFGRPFDSCANEAIISDDIDLNDYHTVVWIVGEESNSDDTLSAAEQTRLTSFLGGGGCLFVTGSEIAWELDSLNQGRTFFENDLHADFVSDDAGVYAATGTTGSIFDGISLTFDDGTLVYDVDWPDVIDASAGSTVALEYDTSGPTTLEDFDDLSGWWDPNSSGQTNAHADSTFTLAGSPTHQGSGSGDLYYRWDTGDFIREYNSNLDVFPAASDLSLWVYGDGSGHELRIAVRDGGDNDIAVNAYTTINFTGWQEIVWTDIANNHTIWSGGGNGVLDGPNVRFDSIQVHKVTATDTGHIYLDDATYTPTGGGGGGGGAAIQWTDGVPGGSRVVMLGFPFETIASVTVRNQMMADVLTF